jgi:hypothetical protein
LAAFGPVGTFGCTKTLHTKTLFTILKALAGFKPYGNFLFAKALDAEAADALLFADAGRALSGFKEGQLEYRSHHFVRIHG